MDIRDQTTWRKVSDVIVDVIYLGGNLHYICMFAQVDYAKDEQWHACWNQDALKRFLNRTDQPSHEKSIIPYNGQHLGQGTVPNCETKGAVAD
jgi:hypothetical protein